jgi:hypothetical protein
LDTYNDKSYNLYIVRRSAAAKKKKIYELVQACDTNPFFQY